MATNEELELLLKEAIEAGDTYLEDDYGRAIRCCCGTEADGINQNHESDCWLVRAKKLLGLE